MKIQVTDLNITLTCRILLNNDHWSIWFSYTITEAVTVDFYMVLERPYLEAYNITDSTERLYLEYEYEKAVSLK